uniref:Transmembrane protein 110 n=1 Tax=Gopherus evgoodei TaxID=1825980 RepID=A0A8C4VSB2_9SAUR
MYFSESFWESHLWITKTPCARLDLRSPSSQCDFVCRLTLCCCCWKGCCIYFRFYDTSKQAIGALFIHFANVFLSGHTAEDPCSLYLMNFILDATLGMLLIWFGVKVVSWVVEHQKYTCLVFGEYGDPPQAAAWIGQCILYLLIMVFEKTVVSLALFIPGWTKLQEILLDYIPDPQLELVLVMFIVPFTVNAVMFWVVDSLIMRKYKQMDSFEGSRSIENPVRNEESQVLLYISGLQGPSQKTRQPGYQVVL